MLGHAICLRACLVSAFSCRPARSHVGLRVREADLSGEGPLALLPEPGVDHSARAGTPRPERRIGPALRSANPDPLGVTRAP